MFWQTLMMGMRINGFTLSTVFPICTNIMTYQGRKVHFFTIKSRFDSYIFVGVSLVGMYEKCGLISSFVNFI